MARSLDNIVLPPAAYVGAHSLEQLLRQRRSVREFAAAPLTLAQLGQLLWAAQGVTDNEGHRTAPSAGALYPIELYVVAGQVAGLTPGIYRYSPNEHSLSPVTGGDKRHAVAAAALHQTWIASAPAVLVFAAVTARTAARYGARAARYVPIEVGHAAQNVYLQAGDLGLAAVDVGAFDDASIATALHLPDKLAPLLLMPVGAPRSSGSAGP